MSPRNPRTYRCQILIIGKLGRYARWSGVLMVMCWLWDGDTGGGYSVWEVDALHLDSESMTSWMKKGMVLTLGRCS